MRYELGDCRMLEMYKETNTGPKDVIERTGYSSSEVSDWAYNRKKMSLATALSICEAMGWDIFRLYELRKIPAKNERERIRQKRE